MVLQATIEPITLWILGLCSNDVGWLTNVTAGHFVLVNLAGVIVIGEFWLWRKVDSKKKAARRYVEWALRRKAATWSLAILLAVVCLVPAAIMLSIEYAVVAYPQAEEAFRIADSEGRTLRSYDNPRRVGTPPNILFLRVFPWPCLLLLPLYGLVCPFLLLYNGAAYRRWYPVG